jgi:hypothetical protein
MRRAAILTASVVLAACSGESKPSSPIQIVSPAADASATLLAGEGKELPIAFSIEGITLRPAGTCGSDPDCGHVHLLIDGTACNAPGAPYNVQSAGSPIGDDRYEVNALFKWCQMATGSHTVRITLQKDDHSDYTDEAGIHIAAEVKVTTVSAAGASAPPSIQITDPGEGATVTLDADDKAPFRYSVENFVVRPAATCASPTVDGHVCGHLHLTINGTDCNGGGIYNVQSASFPIVGEFGVCTSGPIGSKTVKLTLQDNAHGDLPGIPQDSITITAQ